MTADTHHSHRGPWRHRPRDFDGTGYTLQLSNGALLAELCGIDVVCDSAAGMSPRADRVRRWRRRFTLPCSAPPTTTCSFSMSAASPI